MSVEFLSSIEWLNSMSRQLTHLGVSRYLQTDLSILEVAPANAVLGHSMVMILLSNPRMRLVLKTHFNPFKVEEWATTIYHVKIGDLKDSQITDFMKEMSNICAGIIKRELGLHGVETGTSLPLLTRGFDEIFFEKPDGHRTFSDRWMLYSPKGEVFCSIHIELRDPTLFNDMKVGKILSSTLSSGEAEEL